MESHPPPLHIVVVPFTGKGHIIPALHISKKLVVAHGCIVTFVNTEYNHSQMPLLEVTSPIMHNNNTSSDPSRIHFESISDGLPPEFDRATGGREQFEVGRMSNFFEDLIEKLMQHPERGPVACILSDVFMPFTQDVANKFGVPRAAFWIESAAAYASHLIVSEGFSSASERCPATFMELSDLLQSMKTADVFLFDFFVDPFRRLGEDACVLICTFEELEPTALDFLESKSKLYKVGPVISPSFFTGSLQPNNDSSPILETQCLQWLDDHAPLSVIYVCFRSVPYLSKSYIHEFALGLEASEQPFVWVVRPEWICSDSDVLPQGFRERTARRGLITTWAPQLQILLHESVGGFLTHCGWNSTLESITAGVPMIAMPGFGDQPLNCRFVVDKWKVGLRLDVDKEGMISRREVKMNVRALMVGEEGKEMRRRADALKGIARQAMENGSNKELQRFIIWVQQHHCDLISNGNM